MLTMALCSGSVIWLMFQSRKAPQFTSLSLAAVATLPPEVKAMCLISERGLFIKREEKLIVQSTEGKKTTQGDKL